MNKLIKTFSSFIQMIIFEFLKEKQKIIKHKIKHKLIKIYYK